MKSLYAVLLLMAATACVSTIKLPDEERVSSFDVSVDGVFAPGTTTPLPVVTVCSSKYGGEANVPKEARGTKDCPYVIPRGEVDVAVVAKAKNTKGDPTPLTGTLTFRVVPGDIAADYNFRFGDMAGGDLKKTVRASHLYGEVKIWVEDAPPEHLYDAGTRIEYTVSDPTRERTWATGTSPVVYFEEPTLAKVQIPDGFDNRSSPFIGQFMVIGRNPESGSVITQSCADPGPDGKAQPVDGQPATLVVTGTDPSGFFVTDITACRIKEALTDVTGATQVRVAEPDGYLPAGFGSMFIYNYSYPDGLDQGDLLWTLSGAVQEFTSTTQLTFPAWSIREKVRQLPADQWNKYLNLVKPVEINGRICGLDNQAVPFLTDSLCGHNRRNLKLESVESGLVTVKQVRFPEAFSSCDKNADGEVPFFCEGTVNGVWQWQDCDFETDVPAPDAPEMQCLIDCVISGTAKDKDGNVLFSGKRCSERATYDGFGQYVVELSPPGPAAAGFDPSLSARFSQVALSGTSQLFPLAFAGNAEVALWCDSAAKVKAGDDTVVATAADLDVPAKTRKFIRLSGTQTRVAVIANGAPAANAQCYAGFNPETKMNLITKDAVPDLNPDCDVNNPNGDLAEQCRLTLSATYDVTGHLRQLQPGRPRWAILPRDADDVCCHPGPGLSCPKPLKQCP